MHEVIEDILKSRGIVDDTARAVFLSPDYEAHTHDPFLMRDMRKAAERIVCAIQQQETIALYADFDADGIPGAVVLYDTLRKLGVTPRVYIPHRDNEGYGVHEDAVAVLCAEGVSLIVTIDVGISAHKGVEKARSCGIDVVVTDHHELPPELPAAHAVVHPCVGAYPFPLLCGAAVAYKVAQAVLHVARERSLPGVATTPVGWEKWLLDMVGIATLSDMVPLVGENRVLASYGLRVLRKSPRRGIRALCAKNRLRQPYLTEDDVGFSITPRINAASRMDAPELAFRLLATENDAEAQELAHTLEQLNNKRKGAVAAVVKAAREKVAARANDTAVAVVGDPSWKPALLGLAANSVLSGRTGAVCLWGRDATGTIKGSCRSDGSVHIVEMFSRAGILAESGGHAQAGGFSVSHELVHTLPALFAQVATVRTSDEEQLSWHTLPVAAVGRALHEALMPLAPFGVGNPKPLFALSDATVASVRTFGKEHAHTEVVLRTEEGKEVRAFQFYTVPEDFTRLPKIGERITCVGSIELDTFAGARRYAVRIFDIR